jgi:short-subunit dehydrogenase
MKGTEEGMGNSRPLALITGASSGIGAAFARRLAADGYDLALVARRGERLEQLAGELQRQHGAKVDVLVADLTDETGLKGVEEYIAAAGNLELLVNNAGFGTHGRFYESSLAGQDAMHRLHVLATVRLTHAALLKMTARGQGAIINVSSMAAFAQSPGSASYCATKAWMNSFTEGLYLDLKSAGVPVRVQALCPGFTVTEFHDVQGMDRSEVPASWWMSAEAVVDASLQGLARGKLIVVPGALYRFFVIILRLLPRWLYRAFAARDTRKLRRKSGGNG